MNFHYLRAFFTVASERSFTRAAQVLNISQSTLSSQVKALEEDYDVRLLDRRGRFVVPTDVGQVLVEQCRDLFRQQDEMDDFLNRSKKLQSGRLKIGADGPKHVLPVLKTFIDLHPNVSISLTTGNARKVLQDLQNYETDAAIVAVDGVPNHKLYLEKLSTYSLVAFVPKNHSLAARSSITLSDFAGQRLINREPTSMTRRLLTGRLESANIQIDSFIELDSREATREAVACGMGISVMSEVEFPHGDDRIISLPIDDPALQITEYVACLKGRYQTRTIREFFRIAGAVFDKE